MRRSKPAHPNRQRRCHRPDAGSGCIRVLVRHPARPALLNRVGMDGLRLQPVEIGLALEVLRQGRRH